MTLKLTDLQATWLRSHLAQLSDAIDENANNYLIHARRALMQRVDDGILQIPAGTEINERTSERAVEALLDAEALGQAWKVEWRRLREQRTMVRELLRRAKGG